MKTAFPILCLLCSTAAFGQSGSVAVPTLSSQAQPLSMPSHPQHASAQPTASEQNILGNGGYSYGHGERPLWEVMPPRAEVPLGDTARAIKKDRAGTKKATAVFEN